jgi:Flp pilus assembly protein TadB
LRRRKPGAYTTVYDLEERGSPMAGLLWGIVVVLVVLWLLGFVVAHVASPLIHVLLVIAIVVVIINLLAGRRAL